MTKSGLLFQSVRSLPEETLGKNDLNRLEYAPVSAKRQGQFPNFRALNSINLEKSWQPSTSIGEPDFNANHQSSILAILQTLNERVTLLEAAKRNLEEKFLVYKRETDSKIQDIWQTIRDNKNQVHADMQSTQEKWLELKEETLNAIDKRGAEKAEAEEKRNRVLETLGGKLEELSVTYPTNEATTSLIKLSEKTLLLLTRQEQPDKKEEKNIFDNMLSDMPGQPAECFPLSQYELN